MAATAATGTQTLRSVYETSLGPYLAAQDARVISARRTRWIVLFVGVALAGALAYWSVRRNSQTEYPLMLAFVIGVGAIAFFFLVTGELADTLRHRMMADIAPLLGLRYAAAGAGFDHERFALLGLARADSVSCHDRLSGRIGGIDVDMVTAKLFDETTEGIGNDRHTRTTKRFTGVLMVVTDPAPPAARFRLIPPAALSPHGKLRGMSATVHAEAGMPLPSRAGMRAMLAALPEEAPVTATGDAAFDRRFELQASGPDVLLALARLDAATRAALVDIADIFGGGPVSAGFEGGHILLAFLTEQRFEIGALRPPMAEFARVQHLADQMAVVATIAQRIRTAQ